MSRDPHLKLAVVDEDDVLRIIRSEIKWLRILVYILAAGSFAQFLTRVLP